MGVDVGAHIARPLAVVLNPNDVLLLDELILRLQSMVVETDCGPLIDRRAGSSRIWGETATCWGMAETSALVMLGKNAPSVEGGNDRTYVSGPRGVGGSSMAQRAM